MFTSTKPLACILWVASISACAAPSTVRPPLGELESAQEDLQLQAWLEVEATEDAPTPTEAEYDADAPLEAAYDPEGLMLNPEGLMLNPEGLSIGPGSGFIALNDPIVVPGSEATWLISDELILGVSVGDEARAYPISQMAYHHIANDQIDGEPYLVTY